ncbi:hypothetical protein RRG08_058890 [Elysia crispata]|uniref:Uncharacterized protein n=1 Tax=Elysia crispata TaxID=231223 RepID=A0AAE1CPW7_9GAST|nr:hypothetical protein RRG08_058890 [Elysia crispata]
MGANEVLVMGKMGRWAEEGAAFVKLSPALTPRFCFKEFNSPREILMAAIARTFRLHGSVATRTRTHTHTYVHHENPKKHSTVSKDGRAAGKFMPQHIYSWPVMPIYSSIFVHQEANLEARTVMNERHFYPRVQEGSGQDKMRKMFSSGPGPHRALSSSFVRPAVGRREETILELRLMMVSPNSRTNETVERHAPAPLPVLNTNLLSVRRWETESILGAFCAICDVMGLQE